MLAAMPFQDDAGRHPGSCQQHQGGRVAGVWTENGGRGIAHGPRHQEQPGVHQQLWCGRRRGLPVGGVKSSDMGAKKGFEALYGFSVMKTVVIRHG